MADIKDIIIGKVSDFDLTLALQGQSIGFIKEGSSNILDQYIVNFKRNEGTKYQGRGSNDGELYIFDATGQCTSTGSYNGKYLKMLYDKIVLTADTSGGATRAPSGEDPTQYNISTLLPKDSVAAQILNGILSRMTLQEIEDMTPARINQLSSQAYKMAQSMINTAVIYRNKYGAVESEEGGGSIETTTPSTNTEKFLSNISTSIDNLQKKSQANNAGIFLNNTETKPLYVKNIGSSSSGGGGGEISGSITATIQGDMGIHNAQDQSALNITGNSTLGGGQGNLPIIVDSQSQNTIGPIPISIAGGLAGEWRLGGSTTKYSVSKIALSSPAFSIALNAADKSELIVILKEADADYSGLMSDLDYNLLHILEGLVGTKEFKLGVNTYTTLQGALDAINTRLTALGG